MFALRKLKAVVDCYHGCRESLHHVDESTKQDLAHETSCYGATLDAYFVPPHTYVLLIYTMSGGDIHEVPFLLQK